MTKFLEVVCASFVLGASLLPLPVAAQSPQPGIAGLLSGSAVTDQDLGTQHGRGLVISGNDGSVAGNINVSGGGGAITNTDSIKGNAGITTIFQNTGNNSLFQNQTTVNVTIH